MNYINGWRKTPPGQKMDESQGRQGEEATQKWAKVVMKGAQESGMLSS